MKPLSAVEYVGACGVLAALGACALAGMFLLLDSNPVTRHAFHWANEPSCSRCEERRKRKARHDQVEAVRRGLRK